MKKPSEEKDFLKQFRASLMLDEKSTLTLLCSEMASSKTHLADCLYRLRLCDHYRSRLISAASVWDVNLIIVSVVL